MDFVARIGVEMLTDGRLRAAGFMSTMLVGVALHRAVVDVSVWNCRRGRNPGRDRNRNRKRRADCDLGEEGGRMIPGVLQKELRRSDHSSKQ